MKPITKEKALERLAGLCSRAEQCEFELGRKLYEWQLQKSDREEILEYLRANRYFDNQRYADSFANDKSRFSAWGPYKIRMELAKRRISASIIQNALRKIDPEIWKEGLLKNARSKAKSLDLCGNNKREDTQKLFRYLVSRGFSSDSATKGVAYMIKCGNQDNE